MSVHYWLDFVQKSEHKRKNYEEIEEEDREHYVCLIREPFYFELDTLIITKQTKPQKNLISFFFSILIRMLNKIFDKMG